MAKIKKEDSSETVRWANVSRKRSQPPPRDIPYGVTISKIHAPMGGPRRRWANVDVSTKARIMKKACKGVDAAIIAKEEHVSLSTVQKYSKEDSYDDESTEPNSPVTNETAEAGVGLNSRILRKLCKRVSWLDIAIQEKVTESTIINVFAEHAEYVSYHRFERSAWETIPFFDPVTNHRVEMRIAGGEDVLDIAQVEGLPFDSVKRVFEKAGESMDAHSIAYVCGTMPSTVHHEAAERIESSLSEGFPAIQEDDHADN